MSEYDVVAVVGFEVLVWRDAAVVEPLHKMLASLRKRTRYVPNTFSIKLTVSWRALHPVMPCLSDQFEVNKLAFF
jgi:hypothetical protein